VAGRVRLVRLGLAIEIVFLPQEQKNRIKTIESFNGSMRTEAFAG